jgi:hypothetical protein
VKLEGYIYLGGGSSIAYRHDLVTGEHSAQSESFKGHGKVVGTKAEVANFLADFRGHKDVDELFEFLCR